MLPRCWAVQIVRPSAAGSHKFVAHPRPRPRSIALPGGPAAETQLVELKLSPAFGCATLCTLAGGMDFFNRFNAPPRLDHLGQQILRLRFKAFGRFERGSRVVVKPARPLIVFSKLGAG